MACMYLHNKSGSFFSLILVLVLSYVWYCWSIHKGTHSNQTSFIYNYPLHQGSNGIDTGSLDCLQKCFTQKIWSIIMGSWKTCLWAKYHQGLSQLSPNFRIQKNPLGSVLDADDPLPDSDFPHEFWLGRCKVGDLAILYSQQSLSDTRGPPFQICQLILKVCMTKKSIFSPTSPCQASLVRSEESWLQSTWPVCQRES